MRFPPPPPALPPWQTSSGSFPLPVLLKLVVVLPPAPGQPLSCPGAQHIPQVLQGLGWSELAGLRCFSDGVSLRGVCERWREIEVCRVREVSVLLAKAVGDAPLGSELGGGI